MRMKAAGLALLLGVWAIILGVSLQQPNIAAQSTNPERRVVTEVEFLGQASVAVGLLKDDTEIGGLSALTYDSTTDRYYVLSDDRSERDPARFYTVALDLGDGALTNGDVVFVDTTTLLGPGGLPFDPGTIDPEGIALSSQRTLFVASEGALAGPSPINPAIIEFGLGGQQIRTLTLPATFLPDGSDVFGPRNNLNFESLTLSPDARTLTTAVENALLQDGPEADVGVVSLSRTLSFNPVTGQPGGQTVYPTGPALSAVSPSIPHGLVDMVALDNDGTFLTLERGPAAVNGLTVRLYLAQAQGALDVRDVADLMRDDQPVPYEIDPPVSKTLLLDFADLGLPFVNNFEGMTLGPVLPDGRQTLILVSDNNFSFIPSEFVALGLTVESVPAVLPALETPLTYDEANPPSDAIAGDATDAAVWLHPTDPGRSVVALTVQDGGLIVVDLAGELIQTVAPPTYGAVSYNSVDVIYDFPLDGAPGDVFVVSDRANDTLAVFAIDSQTGLLLDVTSPGMPPTLFGIDDGQATAYGLAAYAALDDGRYTVFVTQAAGDLVAQVELSADGAGGVTGTVIRLLELPAPTGDPADSQAEGVVVDRLLGHLYVAQSVTGILKFSAEPDGGPAYTVIHAIDEPYLQPDIEGLALYYGPGSAGYLLASSQGDHTYALFERGGDNAFVGRFSVAAADEIDQANESDGLEVVNAALGSAFPEGLLIVQDGANDPQNAVPEGGQLENNSTNFKFVPWDEVANAFPGPLLIDPGSYDPRYPMRSLLPVALGG